MTASPRAVAEPGSPGPAISAVTRTGALLATALATVLAAAVLFAAAGDTSALAASAATRGPLGTITADTTGPGFSGGPAAGTGGPIGTIGAPSSQPGTGTPGTAAPPTTAPPTTAPATVQPSVVPSIAPVPVTPTGGRGSGPLLLVVLLVLVVLGLLGLLVLRGRPRTTTGTVAPPGPPSGSPPGSPPGSPSGQPPGQPTGRLSGTPPGPSPGTPRRTEPVPSAPSGVAGLVDALRRVGAGTSSVAVAEQIDRLLGRPDVSRDELVAACIRHRDQVRDEPLRAVLQRALAGVGVREVRADGERFDPHRHETVDRAPAADPALHDTVASTERCGYVDNGRVLRVPRVVLHWVPPAGGPFPVDRR